LGAKLNELFSYISFELSALSYQLWAAGFDMPLLRSSGKTGMFISHATTDISLLWSWKNL